MDLGKLRDFSEKKTPPKLKLVDIVLVILYCCYT